MVRPSVARKVVAAWAPQVRTTIWTVSASAAAGQVREEDQEAALAVGLAPQLVPQRGIDLGLQGGAALLPLRDGAVVREQPGAPLEGVRVLQRDPPHAGLADVRQDGGGGHERGDLLEVLVAVRRGQAARNLWHAPDVPSQAPSVRVLAAL